MVVHKIEAKKPQQGTGIPVPQQEIKDVQSGIDSCLLSTEYCP